MAKRWKRGRGWITSRGEKMDRIERMRRPQGKAREMAKERGRVIAQERIREMAKWKAREMAKEEAKAMAQGRGKAIAQERAREMAKWKAREMAKGKAKAMAQGRGICKIQGIRLGNSMAEDIGRIQMAAQSLAGAGIIGKKAMSDGPCHRIWRQGETAAQRVIHLCAAVFSFFVFSCKDLEGWIVLYM